MTKITDSLYAIEAPSQPDANSFFINNIGCIRYSYNKGRESSVIEPQEVGEYLEKDKWTILGTVCPNNPI